MGKANGKSQAEELDLEHELPAADDDEGAGPAAGSQPEPAAASAAEAELHKVKAERDELYERLARVQAEFDNARRRSLKEQQEFRDYATVDAIKSLLPALDSFERALQAKSEGADFRSGVELIHKQLQDALTKLGVQSISAKGAAFDPRFHEAIEMVETDEVPDHQVIDELQRGYKFKDRLLRPAMVRVAKNPGK